MSPTLIESLVPEHVVTAAGPGCCGPEVLLRAERELVANAVERRRREFAAGRACAHRVLARLGWDGYPVLSGAAREPLWPPGIAGSITHCEGYAAAAAARLGDLGAIRGFGIDAEVRASLPPDVTRMVLGERERALVGGADGAGLATAIFSAKEAVYKCWFPLTGRWLDYRDAEIEPNLGSGTFEVRLLPRAPRPPQPFVFSGRMALSQSHVFAVAMAKLESRG